MDFRLRWIVRPLTFKYAEREWTVCLPEVFTISSMIAFSLDVMNIRLPPFFIYTSIRTSKSEKQACASPIWIPLVAIDDVFDFFCRRGEDHFVDVLLLGADDRDA